MSTINFIIIIALNFLLFVFIFYYIKTIFFGVPFVPSDKEIKKSIIDFLKDKNIKNIVELGAGSGTIAFLLSKNGYKVKAIEINPFLSLYMRLIKLIKRDKNITIINNDINKVDYNNTDCIIVYLFPEMLIEIEDKVFSSVNKNGYVLSNTFEFKKHKIFKKINKLNIYKISNNK